MKYVWPFKSTAFDLAKAVDKVNAQTTVSVSRKWEDSVEPDTLNYGMAQIQVKRAFREALRQNIPFSLNRS